MHKRTVHNDDSLDSDALLSTITGVQIGQWLRVLQTKEVFLTCTLNSDYSSLLIKESTCVDNVGPVHFTEIRISLC